MRAEISSVEKPESLPPFVPNRTLGLWLPALAVGLWIVLAPGSRSLRWLVLGMLGAGLLARGVLGLLPGARAPDLGIPLEETPRAQPEEVRFETVTRIGVGEETSQESIPASDYDLVDETSEESFPASDPPAWMHLGIGPPNRRIGTIKVVVSPAQSKP